MKPASRTGRPAALSLAASSALATLMLLSGCGGGSGSAGATSPVSQVPTPPADPGPISNDPGADPIPTDAFGTYWNLCAAPRTGLDSQGKAFPDRQGTLLDELKFLRAWGNDYYL
jgi:hypothetical protein